MHDILLIPGLQFSAIYLFSVCRGERFPKLELKNSRINYKNEDYSTLHNIFLSFCKCINLSFFINQLCNDDINYMSGNYVTHKTFLVSMLHRNKMDQTLILLGFLTNAWGKEADCC